MKESRKFIYYSLGIYAVYTACLYFLGFFSIGLVSDDYMNIYDAINSTFYQKLTGALPFTNTFHIRPFYYLSLEKSVSLSAFFGFAQDNFVWFRIQNLVLFFFIAFSAGLTLFYLTKRASVSLVCSAAILLYPNNINNICWMAARVDLICCFFFIISVLLFFLYSDTGKRSFFVLSLVTFTLALLTKELAITLPAVIILAEYFRKGKAGLKKSMPLAVCVVTLLAVYFIFRIGVLGNNMTEITTLYQSFPLSNAPGVFARALIALSIPLDFITINFQLRNDNKLIIIYLFILYGTAFYLIWNSARSDIYKIIGQLTAFFFILIAPYAIVGYIRPQMILLPFAVLSVFLLYIYSEQKRLSLKFNKNILRAAFAAAMVFWVIWSAITVMDWRTSYEKARINVESLIAAPLEPGKKIVLLGNPGRFKQTFMFDKMTGAYGFWKDKQYSIKDTINDVIQTAAFQESSIGAKLECKTISPNEFEIKAIAPKQFFYIEGYSSERIRTGFKNNDISVEFTEFNTVDKPIRLRLIILSDRVTCFLAEELGFRKIY
ncbi:MAG TPA: hypothetical protein PK753_01105 [Ignavibacteria bacterium]|nr:hypothetical protein [Ignavibacteria bacterium]